MSRRYNNYLRTARWQRMRWALLLVNQHCCEFCGAEGRSEHGGTPGGPSLHVHHLSYDNLGHEPPDDLIVLCDSCHADVHNFPHREAQVAEFSNRRRRWWVA